MSPSTREQLLDAAARLFHEQGYAATGVATILREAGVNSGSLYYHFENKEALLLGVLERYQELLHPVVMNPVEQAEPDHIERVFRLLDWYREGLKASGCRLGCPIGNLALEVADSHPAARDAIHANFLGWSEAVESWLNDAGDRLPPDCDRGAMARFVLTVMEGGLMQARAGGNLAAFDDSVTVLRDHFHKLLTEAEETMETTHEENHHNSDARDNADHGRGRRSR